MLNAGLFSSATGEWSTPQDVYDALDTEFGFTLDPCATPENAKCERYFTKEDDGLAQEWTGVVFMNPPYGRQIGRWLKKAYESALAGATVVCLVPSRTDTRWWLIADIPARVRRWMWRMWERRQQMEGNDGDDVL